MSRGLRTFLRALKPNFATESQGIIWQNSTRTLEQHSILSSPNLVHQWRGKAKLHGIRNARELAADTAKHKAAMTGQSLTEQDMTRQ